ncbi:uncharacterized protein [Symphalangus syndactylus]|uniref:uncharacterized protein n=1 Tax=Symphalangus syndactylus TaxID=9590 RepID=UPI0024426166|nr:uncharacterized protein LOC129462969 [Symphalangus syndactylus]
MFPIHRRGSREEETKNFSGQGAFCPLTCLIWSPWEETPCLEVSVGKKPQGGRNVQQGSIAGKVNQLITLAGHIKSQAPHGKRRPPPRHHLQIQSHWGLVLQHMNPKEGHSSVLNTVLYGLYLHRPSYHHPNPAPELRFPCDMQHGQKKGNQMKHPALQVMPNFPGCSLLLCPACSAPGLLHLSNGTAILQVFLTPDFRPCGQLRNFCQNMNPWVSTPF